MTGSGLRCRACRAEISLDAAFCPECGAAVLARCAHCGTENAAGHRFGSRNARYWFGVGHGQRVLARIARAAGTLGEAEGLLAEASTTFEGIDAGFEVARVHFERAELVGELGDHDGARRHLEPALEAFRRLSVPRYVERAQELASRLRAG